MNPARCCQVDSLGEQTEYDEGGRRRHGEAEPGREAAERAGPPGTDRDAELAAGSSGQELAECDQVGECVLVDPGPPFDVLAAEVAEVVIGPPNDVRPRRSATQSTSTTDPEPGVPVLSTSAPVGHGGHGPARTTWRQFAGRNSARIRSMTLPVGG